MVASGLKGRDAYGVKTMNSDPKERKQTCVRFGCTTANACVRYFCTYAYWLSCRID